MRLIINLLALIPYYVTNTDRALLQLKLLCIAQARAQSGLLLPVNVGLKRFDQRFPRVDGFPDILARNAIEIEVDIHF